MYHSKNSDTDLTLQEDCHDSERTKYKFVKPGLTQSYIVSCLVGQYVLAGTVRIIGAETTVNVSIGAVTIVGISSSSSSGL